MGKRKQANKINKKSNGDTALIQYKGPIAPNPRAAAIQSVRIPLRYRTEIVSSSAGYIEWSINTSQVTGFQEWGAYAPLWKEYRILGIRAEYRPYYDMGGYPGTAVVYGNGNILSFHGGLPSFAGAVTTGTENQVNAYETAKPAHPGMVFSSEWRMQDVEEAQFFSTSTFATTGGIYFMCPQATASRKYGTMFVTMLVEFKGRV